MKGQRVSFSAKDGKDTVYIKGTVQNDAEQGLVLVLVDVKCVHCGHTGYGPRRSESKHKKMVVPWSVLIGPVTFIT
jgi:hypothetical protein